MTARPRPRKPSGRASLPAKWLELQVAAPQVIAHRLGRMATAGPVLSVRDQREFTHMLTEKQAAFWMSWWAMGTELCRIQSELTQASLQGVLTGQPAWIGMSWWQWPTAFQRVLESGLTPVHRRAVANARRLNRTRR
ncbi:hypothetical protein AAV94_13220 [Lampropedia cohaerens]|uniref:Phasin domain-containing protein n=1 Tax=Lampropedia cohaerens TaxID=1610491 RepID=A0A0U1PWZ8_9BURK|nr:polyhydroxyalkanoate granule-associated phasin [Lampropedia cohaerens]KKW67010.1 hypothetical protein AAV94_13220 [Lampropedia cohaerens]